MIDSILTWIQGYEDILVWMAALSLLLFAISILALPFLAALIPQDYFADTARHRTHLSQLHPAVYFSIRLMKNLIGWLLVGAGILMLVLPGQGLLTIFIGLVLSDFPGKFALERRIAGNTKIMSGINWLRGRAGKPPLQIPHQLQGRTTSAPHAEGAEASGAPQVSASEDSPRKDSA